MDALLGWLLPVLLSCALAIPLLRVGRHQREETLLLWGIGGLLCLLTVGLAVQESASWIGPALLQLDSFHEIRVQLNLSLFGLAMIWVCWWFLIRNRETDQTPRHALSIALLFLMILSRDLWLSFSTLVGFSLIHDSLTTRERVASPRTQALHGCHWWGVLLLFLAIAILTFDFQFSHYSFLAEEIRVWDQFSEVQQADLMLAALFASSGLLIIAGILPISALCIDRESTTSTDILGSIIAVLFAYRLLPLFEATQVTGLFAMILLLTVASALLSSLGVASEIKRRQGITLAFLMLGLGGMFLPGEADSFTTLRLLGIEQCLLSLMLWRVWQPSNSGNRGIVVVLAGWLLLSISGWAMVLKLTLSPYGVVSQVIPGLLAGGFAYGVARAFQESRENESTAITPTTKSDHRLDIAVLLLVILAIRLPLWQAGLAWFVLPAWEAVGGAFVGTMMAWGVLKRNSQTRELQRAPNTFQQLAESQFHTLTIWDGLIQIPSAILGGFIGLWELWQLRRQRGVPKQDKDTEPVTPFVWELALGGASLMVLSGLFLWMKG